MQNTSLERARFALDQQLTRLRAWAAKDRTTGNRSAEKIAERADELRDLMQVLELAQHNQIIVTESAEDAYRRGFEAAQRQHGPSRHGIIDRRIELCNCFGAQYNPANEAKRRMHNALQRAKWNDHH